MLYNLALTIGLTIADTDNMTAGELIDLCYYRANRKEQSPKKTDDRRQATQEDYDRF